MTKTVTFCSLGTFFLLLKGYTWPLPLVWPRVHSFGPGPWHGCTGCPPPLTPAAPRTASIRQCDCNRYRVCVRVYVCSQQQKNNKAKWHPTTSQTSYHHYMKWRCTMIFPSAHYRQKPLVVVSYGYNLNLCVCIQIARSRRVAYSVCSQPISRGLWLGLLSCLLLGVFSGQSFLHDSVSVSWSCKESLNGFLDLSLLVVGALSNITLGGVSSSVCVIFFCHPWLISLRLRWGATI